MSPSFGAAFSRKSVLEYCTDESRNTISRPGAHPELIKVGNTVIKFGRVHAEEAYNQLEASMLLDATIICVPKVHDYFVIADCGYLVMEYVDGRQPTVADYPDIIPRIAGCL